MVQLMRPFTDDYHMLENILENLKRTGKKVERCSILVMLEENLDRLGLLMDTMNELRDNISKKSVSDCIDTIREELEEVQIDYFVLAGEFEDYLYCPALDELKD